MKAKERSIVYGRKYIKFARGGKAHKLLSKGICCYVTFAINCIEKTYKGTIFDPEVDFNGRDCLQKNALSGMYAKLSDLNDAMVMAFNLYYTPEFKEFRKLGDWCRRYNEVAKEFSRVNKTKVKVFKPWWQ